MTHWPGSKSASARCGVARTIQRENDRVGELFILRKGVMMSSMLLDDGSRQILRFLFPGDMMGLSSLVYREAPETITAL